MSKRSAFSLIEISMVLVIVGLLVVSAIQGSRMLKKAKITSVRSAIVSSPINYVKDLSGWYDSVSETSFLAAEAVDSSKVSTWGSAAKTSSFLQNNGTQSTTSNKPTYVYGGLSELPKLSFDGDDVITFFDGLFPAGNSSYTVFLVASSAGNGTIINSGSSTNINKMGFDASGNFTVDGGSGNGGSFAVATSGNNVMQIITHSYDGTVSNTSTNKVWVNGVAKTITTLSSGGAARSTAMTPVTIGAASSGFSGKVGEVIIFARNLDDSEREEIEKYLAKKWSIKSGAFDSGAVSDTGSTCTVSTVSNGSIAVTSNHSPAQENDTQTLTCNSGYQASGQTVATCNNGSWSVILGGCTAVCTVPSVSNGTVAVTGNHNPAQPTDTETLTCNSGFVVSGVSTATCQSSGNWSATLGSCQTVCTGGTVTYVCADNSVVSDPSSCSGGTFSYVIHKFTSSGTLTCSSSLVGAQYLVIAGGAGGGSSNTGFHGAGGGGAGGFLTGTTNLSATSYTVTVGAGGAGGTSGGNHGTAGSNSSLGSIATAIGGGYGAKAVSGTDTPGGSGGSGGGSTRHGAGGAATSGQGYNGGSGNVVPCDKGSAGGGGAGSVGGNNPSSCTTGLSSGAGGSGAASSITGSSVTYAGGGGGGGSSAGGPLINPGSGGSGGGGAGAACSASGTSATANTGSGGGGGGCGSGSGGSGGSGIVIVRYSVN